MKSIFILLIALISFTQINAIYTSLNKNEQFCVYKNLESNVNFTGSYVVSGESEELISLRVLSKLP